MGGSAALQLEMSRGRKRDAERAVDAESPTQCPWNRFIFSTDQ